MPTYTFLNSESGIEYDIDLRISELDKYKEKNPNHIQQLSTPAIVGANGGSLSKTSDAWKDRLKSIKSQAGAGNTIKV